MKTLLVAALAICGILGLGRIAIRSYQNAIRHSINARAATGADPGSKVAASSGGSSPIAPFEGDMFAQMPRSTTARSTPAEDQRRAREAAKWVRVVFEPDSHPRFAELLKSELVKHWNPRLGYQLVFEESRGPLEEAATAATFRVQLRTYTADFQQGTQPDVQQFFRAVDAIFYRNQRAVSTSWDMLNLAADKPLAQHFALKPGEAESFNRQRLGELYAAFAKKLETLPSFSFMPEADFDAIRDLYTLQPGIRSDTPAVDPLVFSETADRLIKNRSRPLYRGYLDAICIHLVEVNATNYVDGINNVLTQWLPHVPAERLDILKAHLGFANYALMKNLLTNRQGYLLFKAIPEVWTDPVLGEFSRNYWREKQNSPDLSWLAREFADKFKANPEPPKTPRIFIAGTPQPQQAPVTPTASPTESTPRSTQIPARVPLRERNQNSNPNSP